MVRRGRRRPTKEQIERGKKNDDKDCKEGNHGSNYQPIFGDRYEWDSKGVCCRNCKFETTIDKIDDDFWVKYIKDSAKCHKEAMEKLPLMRRFNKDGY